jgi:putative ABC transport system permease protein
VIVSRGFWLRRLGGRPEAIGKPIRLDGTDHTLAGVLPAIASPLERAQDFFVAAQWDTPRRKGPFFIVALGRLRHESDRPAAAEELRAINRRIFPLWKSSYQDDRASWGLIDLKAQVTGEAGPVAGLALAAVGLVWLIACANASNLLIARMTSRRRELAVRAALGASRGRVVQLLLAESSLLAIGAAAVGVALASAGIRLLQSLGAGYFPRTDEVALDGPVLGVLVGLTVASAFLFGLLPAMHSTGNVDESLRSMGRSSTGSMGVRRLRRILVASQFAVATPLLVVAGLLLASLSQLGRVDLGFDSRNLVTGSLSLPAAQYPDAGRVAAFWDELRRRVEALPGVSAVAFADGLPPDGVGNFNNFDLEDFPAASGQSQPVTPWVAVTPDYFRLLGLSLLEGRLFDERDGRGQFTEVVIVDRAWSKRFFPTGSAIGKRFKEGGCSTCPWTTVVGVVSDVKYAGLDQPNEGSVYTAMAGVGAEDPSRTRFLLLRTGTDPGTLIPAVHQAIRQLDSSLPFSGVATIDERVGQSLQRPRSLSLLIGTFAVVALILSIVGIYGVMAYYVQQHVKDIGIRMALGGTPGDVLRLVVGQGMRVVAGGVVAGLLVAAGMTRLTSSLLFGVSASDTRTFAGVAVLMLLVALVACLLPARRAVGVEPALVLRND